MSRGKCEVFWKTDIKPVIKQYADNGAEDFSPSTSVNRYFLRLVSVVESLFSRSSLSDIVNEGEGGLGSSDIWSCHVDLINASMRTATVL